MTEREAIKLCALAWAAFPGMQEKDPRPTALLWHKLLVDIDYLVAEAALVKVLSTAKFFPAVAEIREAAAVIQRPDAPPAEVAWQEVLQQVKRVGYMGTPTWTHPAIGMAAEALYGGWGNLCQSLTVDNLGVDRAHFFRTYEAMCKREREELQLPPQVRQIASQLAGRMALPGGITSDPRNDGSK